MSHHVNMSELLILAGTSQVRCRQVPVPSSLNSLKVLVAHQCQGDLRVPSHTVLRAAKVNLLAGTHDHGEVHQPSLVLDAVHRDHALEAELLGFGAPSRARSISAAAFAAVQAKPFLGQHAALLLPQLEEPAAALLQQPVTHHFKRERHDHAVDEPRLRHCSPAEFVKSSSRMLSLHHVRLGTDPFNDIKSSVEVGRLDCLDMFEHARLLCGPSQSTPPPLVTYACVCLCSRARVWVGLTTSDLITSQCAPVDEDLSVKINR